MKCAKSKSTTALVLKARLSSCIKDLKRPAHKKAVVLGTLRKTSPDIGSRISSFSFNWVKISLHGEFHPPWLPRIGTFMVGDNKTKIPYNEWLP